MIIFLKYFYFIFMKALEEVATKFYLETTFLHLHTHPCTSFLPRSTLIGWMRPPPHTRGYQMTILLSGLQGSSRRARSESGVGAVAQRTRA
jgi:hypothetical protein